MTDLVERWEEAAKRDDVLDVMVPSDVRQLVGEIKRLREIIDISSAWHRADIRSANDDA